jgi:hypothetical protein
MASNPTIGQTPWGATLNLRLNDIDTKAPLNSPALTGTPTAPDPTTPSGILTKGYVDSGGPFAALGIGTTGASTSSLSFGSSYTDYATVRELSTRTQSTDQLTFLHAIEDTRVYSHNQTGVGGADGDAALYVMVQPTLGVGVNVARLSGLQINSYPQPTGADTTLVVGEMNAITAHWDAPLQGTTTVMRGLMAHLAAIGSTVTTAVGMETEFSTGFGTITNGIGLRMPAGSAAATTWGLQIANYESQHQGLFALGGAAINTPPVYGLDLQATSGTAGAIGLAKQTATPTNPPSSTGEIMYHKGSLHIHAYNDAGTMRWKYLDLAGTGVTWVHSLSAP